MLACKVEDSKKEAKYKCLPDSEINININQENQ